MSNARLILNAILTAFACATITAAANAQSPPIPPAPIPPAPIGNPSAPTPQLVMPPAPRADQFPTPPAPRVAPAPKSETKAAPRPQPRIVRPTPVAPSQPAETQPAETQQVTPAAAGATGPAPDLAYGAYQRGYYLSAFNTATVRQQLGDTKAMTLLGELYSNGYGDMQDDNKAAERYRIAAERRDSEAMFALAMFRMVGRGGAQNREEAARLLAAAAKLGHVASAYNLGLLYLEGRLFPQDFSRPAERSQ